MKNRGRHSAAAQAVAVMGRVVELPRPDAPYDLTDEQSAEWWAVVNRLPADWFPRETHGLLAQYCRLVVRARRLAQMVDQMEKETPLDIKAYRDLVRSEGVVSTAIASLATKMRISQSSSYDKSKVKRSSLLMNKPWENRDDEDDDD